MEHDRLDPTAVAVAVAPRLRSLVLAPISTDSPGGGQHQSHPHVVSPSGFHEGSGHPFARARHAVKSVPDRRLLAVCFQDGDRQRVSVWDLQENAERAVLGEYSARVFDWNSQTMARSWRFLGDGVIGLWDVITSKPLPVHGRASFRNFRAVRAFGGSRFVYWNHVSDMLNVWDPVAGVSCLEWQGFSGLWSGFSPDGELLAVAWNDIVNL